ncbi:hypothetical protein LXA43DRAFT_1184223 [Ganoderma leucocontextum]|nr:hypothetical protein LXA43DRAFT_1184223 [Ganoderma leucocontextum]
MHLPASRCSLGVLSSLPTRSGLSCTPAATWRIHPRPAPPPLVAIVSKKPQAAGSRSPSIHNEYITPSTPRPPSALLHLHIVHRSLDDASNPSATASSPSLPVPCDGGHQSQAPALQQLPLAQRYAYILSPRPHRTPPADNNATSFAVKCVKGEGEPRCSECIKRNEECEQRRGSPVANSTPCEECKRAHVACDWPGAGTCARCVHLGLACTQSVVATSSGIPPTSPAGGAPPSGSSDGSPSPSKSFFDVVLN